MKPVNEILKQRRLELNMTMLDVAKSIGVSEGTVSRWESGNIANMRRDKIAALAKTLHISPAVIMGWEESAKTNSYDLPDVPPPSEVDPDRFAFQMYKKLDSDDKAEIRGEMKQMLKADKYATGTTSTTLIAAKGSAPTKMDTTIEQNIAVVKAVQSLRKKNRK